MPNSPAVTGMTRPAAVVNEEIRAPLAAGGLQAADGRRWYEQLVVEWVAAGRR
ncbi:hypothetical protein [Streptomyces sp. NPDC102282]|uniref:hypothetical protein n=1 Tax=Streptomyces sp. NPDC102282 TaxID=3366154 RepID=UPI00382B6CC7